MHRRELKLLYSLACIGVGFIILSPTLMALVVLPSGERFSELWVLDHNHGAEDYPFSVKANEPYLVYVNVGNHVGSLVYYVLYVKFGNQIDSLPNSKDGVPSSLASLYEYRVFVPENRQVEVPLAFALLNVSFADDECLVGDLMINGVSFEVSKQTEWNVDKNGYYFQLFVELWIYDSLSDSLSFHNWFVSLTLKIADSL